MVLVLGIGNILFQDEGAGVHLLEYLQKKFPHWPVEWMDGGTLSFDLLASITRSRYFIALDAANLDQPAGTIQCLINEQMDQFLKLPGKSVHEVSLSDLMDMSKLTDALPAHRALIGIQPQSIAMGESMSPAIIRAMPEVARQLQALLQNWDIISNHQDTRGSI